MVKGTTMVVKVNSKYYPFIILFVCLFVCLFIYVYLFLRETEKQRMSGGGAEREGETQNLKQAPGSELSAQSPTWGSDSGTVRS